MNIKRSFATLLVALALVGPCVPALAQAPVAFQGSVIIARLSKDPIVIWDCTSDIVDIVHKKLPDAAANNRLEREGIAALASKARALRSTSGTLTVRIIYNQIGDMNPRYKAQTLVGIENYAVITAPAAAVLSNRDKWTTLGARAAIPAWLQFKVVGQLPPR